MSCLWASSPTEATAQKHATGNHGEHSDIYIIAKVARQEKYVRLIVSGYLLSIYYSLAHRNFCVEVI